jgi:hypothetical protein
MQRTIRRFLKARFCESELLAKAERETRQENILRVLGARFGTLPDGFVSGVKAIDDNQQLMNLLVLAVVCPDIDAFRARLRS